MEVTDDLSGRVLRLPMYYEMGEDDIHRVVESIKRYFRIMREKSHVL